MFGAELSDQGGAGQADDLDGADRAAGDQLGEVAGDGRPADGCGSQAQGGYSDGGAAVDRCGKQPGQLSAVVFGAIIGEPRDQGKIVEDVAAHATAAVRCAATAANATRVSTSTGSRSSWRSSAAALVITVAMGTGAG